jgi:uncharacterized membrane protein
MKNSVGKQIAFIGVMFALVFVVLLLETMITKVFLFMPPAVLSIPLAIALSIYADKSKMLVGGTILGVSSFILSFIIGLAVFYNPLVSILPRTIMGIVAYGTYRGVKKLTINSNKNFVKEILPFSIAGAVGVLSNTIGVLGMMSLFAGDNAFLETTLSTIIGLNFSFEFISGLLLVPIYVRTLKKINSKEVVTA